MTEISNNAGATAVSITSLTSEQKSAVSSFDPTAANPSYGSDSTSLKVEQELQNLYTQSKDGQGNTDAYKANQLHVFDDLENAGFSQHDALALVEKARIGASESNAQAAKDGNQAADSVLAQVGSGSLQNDPNVILGELNREGSAATGIDTEQQQGSGGSADSATSVDPNKNSPVTQWPN